jgi:hypothetical protein
MSTHDFPTLRRLTPVLIVAQIESCIGFWTERLGFAVTNEVAAADGALVFASVEKDGIEVMLQTRASVVADRVEAAAELDGHSIVIFIEVTDLHAIERRLDGAPVIKARHRTFYGSTELYVREPGGTVVGFAQFD